jgi:hypothetical protein
VVKVKSSAAVLADVPYPKNTGCPLLSITVSPDRTRTSTWPALWAGVVTTIRVSDTMVNVVASVVPNRTCSRPAAPEKF